MPPCRLLIFVCFSLFARREASFISPDCHYPALNFHRAGREAGQGEAGRGAAGARGGPVGLSPAPRGPLLAHCLSECSDCFPASLRMAFDLPAARLGSFFCYPHFTVKKLRPVTAKGCTPAPSRTGTVSGRGNKAPPLFWQTVPNKESDMVRALNPGRAAETWNPLAPSQEAGR